MKVSELINRLNELDPDVTIRVVVPIEGRPHGGGFLKEIVEVSEGFDQDTNKLGYAIYIADYQKD